MSMKLFPGGIHPREGVNGKAVNRANAIVELPAPARVMIPLSQHIGAPAKALVKKGDRVLMGQLIGEAGGFVSAPVHSSVSGTVFNVAPVPVANGTKTMAVIIDNDFKDEMVELKPSEHPETLTAQEMNEIIRSCGIVGMGGATFPTSVKTTIGQGKKLEKLIINGAECEPYLTADHRLMLEHPQEIIDGIRLMMSALGCGDAVIGIEENKADAIASLSKLAGDGIQVKALPVRYPQGGEKQLVYAVTKRKVPCGGLPLDVGCVVCNVGTVFAIDEAIRKGMPLIRRVTTVGGYVNNPANFMVRIGTPVSNLLEACGGMTAKGKQLISGGPMMGMAVTTAEIPVTKGTSGILVLGDEADTPAESACIRCGRCVEACPMTLMPSKLDTLSRLSKFEAAEKAGALNCIECGACTFVCPAKRSITQSIKVAKTVITKRKREAAAAAAAKKEG